MLGVLPECVVTQQLEDETYDGVLLIGEIQQLGLSGTKYAETLASFSDIDHSSHVKVIPCHAAPGKRIVHAPTGEAMADYDDVRNFQTAAVKCIRRALEAGVKRPLLVLPTHNRYPGCAHVTLLAVLSGCYTPLEVREHKGNAQFHKVEKLGIYSSMYSSNPELTNEMVAEVMAIEYGRTVARDIGGSDPERMAAPRVVEYIEDLFKDSHVTVDVISDPRVFEKDYPLLAAVNRCAGKIHRHAGQLVKLLYTGEGAIEQTLMLVGKGITYDTGGADIKAGGKVMAGMHRDKCGAAAVCGFFKTLQQLKPKGLKVYGSLAMVRNSVGSECYVADEIIVSRAGVRVRVGNTDCEGRMVMCDVLCEMKEMAQTQVNPRLFTIATLTSHVERCYGPNYASAIDNGPARRARVSERIAVGGEEMGDPCEVTRLRKEDFEFNSPGADSLYCDVIQASTKASSQLDRGHMCPVAFMIKASGLSAHGCDSDCPIPYTHIDVAGSAGPFPGLPTGSPLVALTQAFVLNPSS